MNVYTSVSPQNNNESFRKNHKIIDSYKGVNGSTNFIFSNDMVKPSNHIRVLTERRSEDKFLEFLCKSLHVSKIILYAMELGGEALLKVLSNEYQDKDEKYETDVIELGETNFFSNWFVKADKYTQGKDFEIIFPHQH